MTKLKRIGRFAVALVASAALGLAVCSAGSQPSQGKKPVRAKAAKGEKSDLPAGPVVTLTPAVFLIRDPVVLAELKLSEDQKTALAELAPAANEEAWKFRDLVPQAGVGSEAVQKLNDLLETSLRKLLSAGQYERLEQVVRQVQGPEAISEPKAAERLGFSASQTERIARLNADNRTVLNEIRAQAKSGNNLAGLYRQAEKLRTGLKKDLVATLTPAQRERWSELLGKPIDLEKLQPLRAQAPELRGVEAWINSPPLTLEGLRGQVVVLHFWTFG